MSTTQVQTLAQGDVNGLKREENLLVDGWKGAKRSQMCAQERESVTNVKYEM